MYAATTEGALQEYIVNTGTLLIHSVPTLVLFDLGNTHTFLARTFEDRIGLAVGDLGHDSVVSTPVNSTLTTGVCVRGIPVVIQHHTLLTDFVVLPMRQFDTTFCMDWMTMHRALINCPKKMV